MQTDGDVPFSDQYDQIALNKIFFRKAINAVSMSLLAPFIVQSFKIILTADHEL